MSNILKRTIYRIRLSKILKKKINCPYICYGNIYGGFYVNPEPLDADSFVYPFGIGKDISFN